MTNLATLRAKDITETVQLPELGFDLISQLLPGETVASAQVTASVYSGADANPSAILAGPPALSLTKVLQLFTAGVAGVIYLITVTGSGSQGSSFTLQGYLACTTTSPSSGFLWYGVRLPWIIGGWL